MGSAPGSNTSSALPRLHIVTGKGGTGKTTVASALALALARDGRRVLLIETEERQAIAQLFDLPPLPYEERRIAVAAGGGEVRALAIDVEAALLEYFALFYNLGFAARPLKKLGAVEFATTLAPGLRDVLLTGKIKETVTRRDPAGPRNPAGPRTPAGRRDTATRRGKARTSTEGPHTYDAVVVDGPPTGRIVKFLNVTVAMADLARRGPIRSQADGVISLLHSPQTAVHLVSLLEDMPVTETLEAIEELADVDIPTGSIVINRAGGQHLPESHWDSARDGTVNTTTLRRGLRTAGIEPDKAMVAGLVQEIRHHALRADDETRCRDDLSAAGLPLITLPVMPDGVELGEVYELADLLTDQGVEV